MDVYVVTGFAYRAVSYHDYYENNNDVLLVWLPVFGITLSQNSLSILKVDMTA